MKPNLSKVRIFLVALWSVFALACGAQPADELRSEVASLKNALQKHHYAPKTIDDGFSEALFNQVFSILDPNKVLFTQADLQGLGVYKTLLDDEIAGRQWSFAGKLGERYATALRKAGQSIDKMLQTKPDFSNEESFDRNPENWPLNDEQLIVRQKQWLEYKILEKLSEIALRDSITCSKAYATRLDEAVKRVRRTVQREISDVIADAKAVEERIAKAFVDGITALHDPHTEYFSSQALKKFMSSLATEDLAFGFSIGENELGELVITNLEPGSAAWKSGELHVDDVILFLNDYTKEVDMTGLSLDEADAIFDDMNALVIELTVRKPDGTVKKVRLRKAKIETSQNVVKSFVLNGDRKIGYIQLPSFYTQWGSTTEGSRCANDVAKEILKLRQDDIDGLILDLRFNGGGSLYEAVALAGIFIDEGALSILRDREKIISMKDMNRGTVYNGPLVVMVNGRSASASELVAAAIQDYNRGLIVGSRTFGKATGQEILPVRDLPNNASGGFEKFLDKTGGFVKVTREKLYRVTGKSLQGKGLDPDILLPDIFTALNYHELNLPFAMENDSVVKNTYFKKLPELDVKTLRTQSAARTQASFGEAARTIEALAENFSDISTRPLSLVKHCERQTTVNRLVSPVVQKAFQVETPGANKVHLDISDHASESNLKNSERLAEDPYLEETYFIISDLINLKKP